MKDSIAYKTLDNITVVLLAFNNLRTTLVAELKSSSQTESFDDRDRQVGGIINEDQQSSSNEPRIVTHDNNAPLDNSDSANGGLIYAENKDITGLSNDDICKRLNLPNLDLAITDVQKMTKKSKMPNHIQSSKTIQSY